MSKRNTAMKVKRPVGQVSARELSARIIRWKTIYAEEIVPARAVERKEAQMKTAARRDANKVKYAKA